MANNRVVVNFDFKANTQDVRAQLKNLQQDLLQLSTSVNTTGMTGKMAQGLREASQAAIQLRGHLANAVNPVTGGLDLSKLSASLHSAGQDLTTFSTKLLQGGQQGQLAFKNLANTIMSTKSPIMQSNALLDKMWGTLKNTARWQISSAILTGFISSISKGVTYAKELNSTLNDIRIVTGHSKEQMDDLARSANKMAKELKSTTSELLKAQLLFYQQGDSASLAAEKAVIVDKAAKVSFNSSAQQMSEYFTAIWNSYQVGEAEMERFADVLAALGAATATSMEEIATAMQKVAATGNSVGVTYEQLSATIATISSATRVGAEQVGTALKTIYARIGDLKLGKTDEDDIGLGQVSSQLLSAGIHIADTEGNLRDLGEVVEEIGYKWGDWSEAQRVAVVQAIAGKRQYTQMMALFDNWDKYIENVGTAENAEGTLTEQHEIWAESWEAASERVKQAAGEVYQKIFDDDVFISMTNTLADVIGIFDDLINMSGGFGTVLSNLGIILTKVFSTQLANGLATLGYNIRVLFTDSTKVAQSMRDSVTTQVMASEGFKNLSSSAQNYIISLRDISEAQKFYENNAKNLSAQDKAVAETQITVIQQLKAEGQAALETAEQYKNLAVEMAKKGSLGQKTQTVNQAVDLTQQINQINNYRQALAHLSTGSGAKTATTDIKEMSAALDLAKLRFGENSKEVKQLQAALESGKMSFNDIRVATNGVQGHVDELDKKIEVLANSLGIKSPQKVQAFKEAIKNAGFNMDTFGQKTDAADKEFEEFQRRMEMSKNYMTFSQSIMTLSSALMGVSSAITSVTSAMRVFEDEESTTTEKIQAIVGVITGFMFAAISIIPAITAVKKSINVLGNEALKSGAKATAMWSAYLWPVVAVVAAIAGVVALIAGIWDATHTSGKELDKAQEKAQKAREELEETNKTLEETNSRIDELLNKDKLTLVEEQELVKLKEEQAYLERNVELLKKKAELENEKANETALKYAAGYTAKNYLGEGTSKNEKGQLEQSVNLYDKTGENLITSNFTKEEIQKKISEIEARQREGKSFGVDSNNLTALYNALNTINTASENLNENTQHVIDDLNDLEERERKIVGMSETAMNARKEFREQEYALAEQLYGKDSEAFKKYQAEKMNSLMVTLSEEDEKIAELLADKSKKEKALAEGTASTEDYSTQYNNMQTYLTYLNDAKEKGVITAEEYSAAYSAAYNEISQNVGLIAASIYNKLGEEGKNLFKGTLDGLVELENKLTSGEIAVEDYVEGINSSLEDLNFEETFEGNQDALNEFIAQMGGKLANTVASATKSFNSGEMSISDYGETLVSSMKAQKKLMEETGDTSSEAFKKLTADIEDAEQKLNDFSGVTDVIENTLGKLDDWGQLTGEKLKTYTTSLMGEISSASEEFQNTFLEKLNATSEETYKSVADVSTALANGQLDAETVTEAALNSAESNMSDLASSAGDALIALGDLIGGFDYSVSFTPKIGVPLEIPVKLGKNEDGGRSIDISLPSATLGIKGEAGDGTKAALAKFSGAIKNIGTNLKSGAQKEQFDANSIFGKYKPKSTGGKKINEDDNTNKKGGSSKEATWKDYYEKELRDLEVLADKHGWDLKKLGEEKQKLYNKYVSHMFDIQDEKTGETYEKYFMDKEDEYIEDLKNAAKEKFEDALEEISEGNSSIFIATNEAIMNSLVPSEGAAKKKLDELQSVTESFVQGANKILSDIPDKLQPQLLQTDSLVSMPSAEELNKTFGDMLDESKLKGGKWTSEEKEGIATDFISSIESMLDRVSGDIDSEASNLTFETGFVDYEGQIKQYDKLIENAENYVDVLRAQGISEQTINDYIQSSVIPLKEKQRDLIADEAKAKEEALEQEIEMSEFYGYKNGESEISLKQKALEEKEKLTQEQILAEYGTYEAYWKDLSARRLEIDKLEKTELENNFADSMENISNSLPSTDSLRKVINDAMNAATEQGFNWSAEEVEEMTQQYVDAVTSSIDNAAQDLEDSFSLLEFETGEIDLSAKAQSYEELINQAEDYIDVMRESGATEEQIAEYYKNSILPLKQEQRDIQGEILKQQDKELEQKIEVAKFNGDITDEDELDLAQLKLNETKNLSLENALAKYGSKEAWEDEIYKQERDIAQKERNNRKKARDNKQAQEDWEDKTRQLKYGEDSNDTKLLDANSELLELQSMSQKDIMDFYGSKEAWEEAIREKKYEILEIEQDELSDQLKKEDEMFNDYLEQRKFEGNLDLSEEIELKKEDLIKENGLTQEEIIAKYGSKEAWEEALKTKGKEIQELERENLGDQLKKEDEALDKKIRDAKFYGGVSDPDYEIKLRKEQLEKEKSLTQEEIMAKYGSKEAWEEAVDNMQYEIDNMVKDDIVSSFNKDVDKLATSSLRMNKSKVDILKEVLDAGKENGFEWTKEEREEFIGQYVDTISSAVSKAKADMEDQFSKQEFFSGQVNYAAQIKQTQDLLQGALEWKEALIANGATNEQIKEYYDNNIMPLHEKVRDLVKSELAEQKKAAEHYMKMSEFYGYKNGDNEIKARARAYEKLTNLTDEQILLEYGTWQEYWYALEDARMEIDQLRREKLKAALEKEKDDRLAILEAEKNAAEKLFEGESTLREKRKQINDQLQESLTLYQYLDKETRKLIFNEKDYLKLSNTLNEIEAEMYDLNEQYLKDIVGKEADEIEYINSEYERQNELLMKRYDIAEKELNIIKARTKLENIQKERNTQMFINGQWQWVADVNAIAEAQKELNDAEFERDTLTLEEQQEKLIQSFEKQIEGVNEVWEKAQKELEETVLSVDEVLGSFGGELDEITQKFYDVAKGMDAFSKSLDPEAQTENTVAYESTGAGIGESAPFNKDINYQALINEAIANNADPAYIEVLKRSRAAKIASMNKAATGTRSANSALYQINEIGEETFVTPDGHFRNFAGGEVVFTHKQSQRLFSLLNADLFDTGKGIGNVGNFKQSSSNDTYINIGGISVDTTSQDGKDLIEILQRITNI